MGEGSAQRSLEGLKKGDLEAEASFNYCPILNEFYQLNNHVWILLPTIDH